MAAKTVATNPRKGEKQMRKLLIAGFVALGFCSPLGAPLVESAHANTAESAPSVTPAKSVEATIDKVIEIVEAFPSEGQAKLRRDKMREVINPKFDFAEMAKRSLGSHWLERSAEERKEFVNVFSDLLARTYLARIEHVQRGMVKISSETVDAKRAVVRTMVTHRGDTFPINYVMVNRDNEWKVYDVVIESIGLVANYRNEFAGIIRKEKFSGLMERLREKAAA